MKIGYDGPLYVMPFDHRYPYAAEVFGFAEPMTPEQIAQAAARKQVVYEAFCRALADGVQPRAQRHPGRRASSARRFCTKPAGKGNSPSCPPRRAATTNSISTTASNGPSTSKLSGRRLPRCWCITIRRVTSARNQPQIGRLKRISDYCRRQGLYFMFELIVPPGSSTIEPRRRRPAGVRRRAAPGFDGPSMREIQDLGIEPDVWKIEGLDRREDGAAALPQPRGATAATGWDVSFWGGAKISKKCVTGWKRPLACRASAGLPSAVRPSRSRWWR